MSALSTRLVRLLNMVPYFQANPRITRAEAAAELGVTAKQLEEDLNQLWMCGLPGYSPGDLIDFEFCGDTIEVTFSAGIDRPLKLTSPEAVDLLVQLAAGDARRALTALEVAAEAAQAAGELVSVQTIERSVDKAAVRYDRDGDQHYDVVSAFIKSVRGSDVDAALHYLARMLVAGEDPRFIARRLMILASEDIGMAGPSALQVAVAAAQTVALIGMPEAQLTLAHATIHLATAPKSNAVTTALAAAMNDIKAGKAGLVPAHLRDGHYSGAAALGNAQGYKYSHDDPDGVVAQQYPPDELVDVDYYRPTGRGGEREIAGRLDRLRAIIRKKRG